MKNDTIKPEIIHLLKSQGCLICKQKDDTHIHHVTTRGAGGSNDPDNLVCLCPAHHVEIHTIGVKTFADKYPYFDDWLRIAKPHLRQRWQAKGI